MSPRLAISAALSILAMVAFVLFGTDPAPDPFGADRFGAEAAEGAIRAAVPAPAHAAVSALPALRPGLLR